jgi:hypothetical protein
VGIVRTTVRVELHLSEGGHSAPRILILGIPRPAAFRPMKPNGVQID